MHGTIQVCESTFPTVNFMKTRYRLTTSNKTLFSWALKTLWMVTVFESHEIRRQLVLGKKTMTNLDSVLKSKDITLTAKVCVVKAMVFPVVL